MKCITLITNKNMNTKNIIIAVVLVIIAFYGGMKYDQSKTVTPTAGTGNFAQGGGRGGRFAGGGAGAVSGNILSVDASGITVQLRDGSSKIVVIPASASIVKSVPGSSSDLAVGKGVIANGTANSDGSVTAANVQIRQAMTMSTSTRPVGQ